LEEKRGLDTSPPVSQKLLAQSENRRTPTSGTRHNLLSGDLQSRLEIFLNKYCRAYEGKQLRRFAALFTSDAMEKGRPFKLLLDQYQRNFDKVDTMDYRIKLKGYAIQQGTGAVRIQGVFHVQARMAQSGGWVESSGPIAMELVAVGGDFRIRRLDY
jgi:hypothetical protein